MRGELGQTSLPVLLRHFYAERKTGTLRVSSGGSERRLHFRKGAVVFADEGDAVPAPPRESAEAILFSLFSWTSGEFAFEEGEPPVDDALVVTRPPAQLILEGSRSVEEPRILERFLGTASTLFACSETTELPLFSIKLAPEESAVLAHARACARFSAAELSQVGSELSMRRALNTLVSLGLLQTVHMEEASEPEPQPEAPPPSPLSFDAIPSEVEELLDSFPSRRPPNVPEPRPAPVPAVEPPAPVAAEIREAATIGPSRARAIPRNLQKLRLVAAVGALLLIAAVTVVLWPSSEREDRPAAQPVVEAAEPSLPGPEPAAEAGPSEAELFYQASLAVERGELESAREQLAALLARRPDFSAARKLLARVDRDLLTSALPPPSAPPASSASSAPKPEPRPRVAASASAPERSAESQKPAPAALPGEGEPTGAQNTLDAHEAEGDSLPSGASGASRGSRKSAPGLPLEYRARHDHRIGGCDGILALAGGGIGYRSREHEWFWSFSELAKTERKDERRLRLETRAKKSFNFELDDPLPESDWTRFLALRPR